jgi:hypothetical protein
MTSPTRKSQRCSRRRTHPNHLNGLRIKVLPPYGVAHDGTAYFPGHTPEVPQSVADAWIRNNWVESVDS